MCEIFPCISNFLEEISSLSHSIVFLYFFALITEAFLFLFAFLWNSYHVPCDKVKNEKKVLVVQSCLTLCDPRDCSLPGSSALGIFQERILVGCHFLFQGIFPMQGLNLGLLHCGQILYHLSSNLDNCRNVILLTGSFGK